MYYNGTGREDNVFVVGGESSLHRGERHSRGIVLLGNFIGTTAGHLLISRVTTIFHRVVQGRCRVIYLGHSSSVHPQLSHFLTLPTPLMTLTIKIISVVVFQNNILLLQTSSNSSGSSSHYGPRVEEKDMRRHNYPNPADTSPSSAGIMNHNPGWDEDERRHLKFRDIGRRAEPNGS